LSKDEEQVLKDLENKIEKIISPYKSHGAFVRLSTRSPKDAALTEENTLKNFEEELKSVPEPSRHTDENARLGALISASTKTLKVHSGAESLHLIKISERSNEDILLALEFPDMWEMKIIIRKWEYIHPWLEFRGFVCNNQFTALSQYFHIAYFEELKIHKKDIEEKIKRFYEEQIKDILKKYKNFVIDFGILNYGMKGQERVIVIELNPFHDYEGCGTDPGLFSWKDDREIVDGKKEFVFRIREEPFDVKKNIMQGWRDMIAVKK